MREAPHDRDREIERHRIFNAAVASMATQLGRRPVLYGPDNKPLPPRISASSNTFSRKSAQRTGTMSNWIPKRLYDPRAVARERESIAERCVELTQDNPYAAGIKKSFAVTVVGPGLIPQPEIDSDALGISKEAARPIRAQMRSIYRRWIPWADAGERMTAGGIQYLLEATTVQHGEHILLPLMINAPGRPYALACQVINPLRLKTPTDKLSNGNIRDGVEINKYGAPVAHWIKKADYPVAGEKKRQWFYRPDTSANFERIPTRAGHRWQVIHQFINDDPDAVRGISDFAPSLKFFQDLNDLLDAELVSSIVTAAFSMFIETGAASAYDFAESMPGFNDTGTDRDGGVNKKIRYQEVIPGAVMYGEKGEVPHGISTNRPGTTFDPFAQIILNAIAGPIGVPAVALFKNLKGVSFAGWRGAMLEAWRAYMFRRAWLGQNTLAPVRQMLLEEAYLRRELTVPDFYSNMESLCAVSWRGYPKGDIEPVKAAQADVLLNNNDMKTLEEIAAERGTTVEALIEQLAEEQQMKKDAGLEAREKTPMIIKDKDDKDNTDEETDDEE